MMMLSNARSNYLTLFSRIIYFFRIIVKVVFKSSIRNISTFDDIFIKQL
jgi:hypothetical protein